MASSWGAAGNFSARPNYDLYMEVYLYDTSGNSSRWAWYLYTRQRSGADSWALDGLGWSTNVNGHTGGGSHSMDFRGATTQILMGSGVTGYIAHDANGWLWVSFSASMPSASVFGSASLSAGFTSNRIPKPPYQPPQPAFLSATSSVLNFTIQGPADNGGSAILDYTLELSTNAGFTAIVQTRVSGASAQTFTGLDPATTYYLRHRARNAYGTGPNSTARAAATLASVTSPPLNPAIPSASPTSLTLEWDVPATNGGAAITGYRITRALNPEFTQGVVQYTQGDVLSRAFSDLLPSTTYHFKVAAQNSVGYSADSEAISFTTVSGVYYSNGILWQSAGVFVSDGTNWVPAEILVSDGVAYIAAI